MQSLLSLDGTVVIQVANFAVFVGALNIVYLRPAVRALAARREHINAITSDYEQARAEAKQLRTAGDARRLAVRRECEELLTKARIEATNEADSIAARSAALAHERSSAAQATVAGELLEASGREAALVEELAQALLQRAIGVSR